MKKVICLECRTYSYNCGFGCSKMHIIEVNYRFKLPRKTSSDWKAICAVLMPESKRLQKDRYVNTFHALSVGKVPRRQKLKIALWGLEP